MRKALIVLVGVLVVGLAGAGWYVTQPLGLQVTDCGFDADGAYARVRVSNLLGFSAHDQRVAVAFSMPVRHRRDVATFQHGLARVTVPARGRATALVQAHYPPHGSFLEGTHPDFHVKGRTVYRLGDGFTGRFVTRKFVLTHPDPAYQDHIYIETVPADPGSLRCAASLVGEEQNDD